MGQENNQEGFVVSLLAYLLIGSQFIAGLHTHTNINERVRWKVMSCFSATLFCVSPVGVYVCALGDVLFIDLVPSGLSIASDFRSLEVLDAVIGWMCSVSMHTA